MNTGISIVRPSSDVFSQLQSLSGSAVAVISLPHAYSAGLSHRVPFLWKRPTFVMPIQLATATERRCCIKDALGLLYRRVLDIMTFTFVFKKVR